MAPRFIRPSRYWIKPEEDTDPRRAALHRLAQNTIKSLNLEALCARAAAVRAKRDGMDIPCLIDPSIYQIGWFNIVLELLFEDQVCWIARIRLPNTGAHSPSLPELEKEVLKSEVDTIKYVKAHTTIPVPEVYDYNFNTNLSDNPIGAPYMLMKALEGRPLGAGFRKQIPPQHQEKVLSRVADYWIQLSQLRFPKIGRLEEVGCRDGSMKYEVKTLIHAPGCQWPSESGPFSTSIDYFFTTRQLDYRECLRKDPFDSDGGFTAWLRLQTAIAMVNPDFSHGPFPLYHPDMRLANILFDEDYNVTGVIDWSYVQPAPIEAFVNFQSDFGADDVRHDFIKHLKRYEAQIDAKTPISNYLSTHKTAAETIFTLQAWTPDKGGRMIVGKRLLPKLFGKVIRWDEMKELWQESELYPTTLKEPEEINWGLEIILGCMLAIVLTWIFYWCTLLDVTGYGQTPFNCTLSVLMR